VASFKSRRLYPLEGTPTSFGQNVGLASGTAWTPLKTQKLFPLPEIEKKFIVIDVVV
jgi:hypothetical protein